MGSAESTCSRCLRAPQCLDCNRLLQWAHLVIAGAWSTRPGLGVLRINIRFFCYLSAVGSAQTTCTRCSLASLCLNAVWHRRCVDFANGWDPRVNWVSKYGSWHLTTTRGLGFRGIMGPGGGGAARTRAGGGGCSSGGLVGGPGSPLSHRG